MVSLITPVLLGFHHDAGIFDDLSRPVHGVGQVEP